MSNMVHVCNNLCDRYKSQHKAKINVRYSLGQKYCTQCTNWLLWEGRWCPCCGHMLRSKARASKLKEEYVRIG